MKLHDRSEEDRGTENHRNPKASLSLALVLSMIASGDANVQGVMQKIESQKAMSAPENPYDAALLEQIDSDIDVALKECATCRNILAIPVVLSKLKITERVTIEQLRAAAKDSVSDDLFATTDRSLSILEWNPHLAQKASLLVDRKLEKLSLTDPRRLSLSALHSLCKKQMFAPSVEQASLR